jgi:hypothetical protein
MKRSEALVGLALASCSLSAACAPLIRGLTGTDGLPQYPTAFGSQLYPSDDITESISILAACGSTLLRATMSTDYVYFDALFAKAQAHGMRVIVISPYASQPVNADAYAASVVAFHRRYAAYEPLWELWNEPNLQSYWGAPPDAAAYSALAIPTADALLAAGARDVMSGGTSGVDVGWISSLILNGVFKHVPICAVHSYEDPNKALNKYMQVMSLLPHVPIYTTEACVLTNDQISFFKDMWSLHRQLSLPGLVWCEFRDGTAGPSPPYTDPMGLVTAGYQRKDIYFTVQAALAQQTSLTNT